MKKDFTLMIIVILGIGASVVVLTVAGINPFSSAPYTNNLPTAPTSYSRDN